MFMYNIIYTRCRAQDIITPALIYNTHIPNDTSRPPHRVIDSSHVFIYNSYYITILDSIVLYCCV